MGSVVSDIRVQPGGGTYVGSTTSGSNSSTVTGENSTAIQTVVRNEGVAGVDGTDGTSIRSGVSDPQLSDGNVGDFYINSTTTTLFGPKTELGWGVGTSLKGDQGDNGAIVGNLTADRVDYNGESLDTILGNILYVTPAISSFTNSVVQSEIGSSVASVVLNWVINKDVLSQTVNGQTISPILRTQTRSGPFTANTTWTLVVQDERQSISSSTTLNFRSKRYWGVSPNTSLSDAEIISLSSELTTSKSKTVQYNATGGRYIYYVYPASLGTVTATVGGLGFSDFTVTTRDFVNASGATLSYNIVRFNTIQNGSNIEVIWS